MGRKFTIFQKAVLINVAILSKVWYIAHTYPLSKKHSNLIDKELFPLLWNSKYNPIRWDIICQSKQMED